MTRPDLAGIIERDRAFQPKPGTGSTWNVAPTDTKLRLLEDRRALLGLLRETRESIEDLAVWFPGDAAPRSIVGDDLGWDEVISRKAVLYALEPLLAEP